MKRCGKRWLSFMLAMVMVVGCVCWKPLQAKAVVVESTAALGAAATVCVVDYSTAALLLSGMKTGAVTSSVVGLMDTYATATGAAASGTALATTIGAGTVITAAGSLVLGAAAAIALIKFVEWLREDNGLEPGGAETPISVVVGRYNYLVDGTRIVFSKTTGTAFNFGTVYETEVGSRFSVLLDGDTASITFIRPDGTEHEEERNYKSYNISNAQYYRIYGNKTYNEVNLYFMGDGFTAFNSSFSFSPYDFLYSSSGASSIEDNFVVVPNPEFQEFPDAIPEGQTMVISPGIADLPQDDPQAAADAIMQTAIDGALAPTVIIEADPTVTPDPDPEPEPDSGATETTGWLSRILESIKALPKQIAEAISSIFVPSPDFFPTAISNLKDAYSDRMGLLTYPISVLFDFLDRVLNLNDQPPILRWDNVYLPGYPGTPVVSAGQYNLNDTLSTSAGRQVHEIYLIVVDAIMILAFLDLCRRKYQKIMHN